MKVRTALTIFSVLVVGICAGALARKSSPTRAASQAYRTSAVDTGPITQVVQSNGTLQAVSTVTVGAEVNGTVIERDADFNDRVKKGQILLRIDPTIYEARMRQARAQVASAEARLSYSRAALERNQALVDQGFIAAPQLDQSRREFESGQADVDGARSQMESAVADLRRCVIRAPVDGVVIKRSVDVGQSVVASFQTPELYVIARDLSEMEIHANVSEADVGQVRAGQEVRFSVDAYPGRDFNGKVRQVRLAANASQGIVTYTVLIAVQNTNGLISPGMTAQTRIAIANKAQTVRLPTAALRFKPDEDGPGSPASSGSGTLPVKPAESINDPADDGAFVQSLGSERRARAYTIDADGRPKAHDIVVGLHNTRFTEIVSGDLKVGDIVITRKVARLEP